MIASTASAAAAAAREIRSRLSRVALRPASLARYLASERMPGRVILCASDEPPSRALAFLERAASRVLWPAPPADFDDAIGGLRTTHTAPVSPRARVVRQHATVARQHAAVARQHAAVARRRSGPASRQDEGLAAALLLEGRVESERALAALRSSTRDWIVESARHVRIPDGTLASLARDGVRWSALEPVELIAVYAGAALARVLRRKAPWLSPGTPVWVRPAGRARRRAPR